MFNTNLKHDILIKLGSAVGSDVPFCIFGGIMLAEGRGDILTKLTPLPPCFIVICKPAFSCSTPELFKMINCRKIKIRPDTDGIITALTNSDIYSAVRRMYNVFEDFLPRGTGDIEEIKYIMLNNGALGSFMTGSGPTVFGVFDDDVKAQKTFTVLRQDYEECFITLPVTYR